MFFCKVHPEHSSLVLAKNGLGKYKLYNSLGYIKNVWGYSKLPILLRVFHGCLPVKKIKDVLQYEEITIRVKPLTIKS